MLGDQGIRFKFAPLVKIRDNGTVTLTLPYAGANRIRFEGLPAIAQVLSPPRQTPLASYGRLTEVVIQVKFTPDTNHAG